MLYLPTDDPRAKAAVAAIHTGDISSLRRLLVAHPELATAQLGETPPRGMSRTLLHVATDWPGHFPDVTVTIQVLVEAGADVNARFSGPHTETPLHWAASSNDLAALDALLDAGADLEAPGSVLGGGPPLSDATGFAQWAAAHRLVARGAHTTIGDAAALGLHARLEEYFASGHPAPTSADVTRAFWGACHGGQRETAEYLLARGAELNWLPSWEDVTPLDAAERSGATAVAAWLRSLGARSATDLKAQGDR
jgi:uncharacterized protein